MEAATRCRSVLVHNRACSWLWLTHGPVQVTQSLQPDMTEEPVSESAPAAPDAQADEPSIIREPEHVAEEVRPQVQTQKV